MAYLKLRIVLLALYFCVAGTSSALNVEVLKSVQANQRIEWTFVSTKAYKDPFNQIELNVEFTTPTGKKLLVPAFWDGSNTWRVRYASPEIGTHLFTSHC